MGESGCLRHPTSLIAQRGGIQGHGSGLQQNDLDCTGMAQQLGSGLSVQIPFVLPLQPDLVTLFNGHPHQNPKNLNLHAWLLEPPLFRNKVSLKWQQGLRLLKDLQPEQSTNRSRPFLSNGAGQKRWTSGRPL